MMVSRLGALVLVASSLQLLGCAAPYKTFYKPFSGATPDAIAAFRAGPPPPTPAVERVPPGDEKAVGEAYLRRGFVPIGQSFFNGGTNVREAEAIQQGKDLGADLVLLVDPRYTGSVTSVVPIITPTTVTSYSSGTATAYGPGGMVTAYGSGTTTSYGSTTNYVPVTGQRFDYGAVFFVKRQPPVLGVFGRPLNDSERAELQTNKGFVVTVVGDNSPAFAADLLKGDILMSIDGVTFSTQQEMGSLLATRRGREIALSIVRGGKRIDKMVQLNP